MLKRLNIYCREMYPILPRLGLGYLIAGEIYFIVLLNHGVTWSEIWPSICARHGIQELILGFTVFCFLFWLRIADDFKDYELDCRLFAHRPLPSRRQTRRTRHRPQFREDQGLHTRRQDAHGETQRASRFVHPPQSDSWLAGWCGPQNARDHHPL